MKTITRSIAVCSVILLAGCAARPDNIPASFVPDHTYSGLTCPQLSVAEQNVSQALEVASAAQKINRANDATAIVFLLGPFYSHFSEANASDQIAEIKAHKNAIRRAQVKAACVRVVPRHWITQ